MDEFVLHIWITDKTGSVSTYAVKGSTWKEFFTHLLIRLKAARFICRLIKGEKVDLYFSKPGVKPALAPPASNSNFFMESCLRFNLSGREADVAALLVKACSDKEMCNALNIGYNGLNSHIKNIYSKMNVHSRSEFLLKFNEKPAPVPLPVECLTLYIGRLLSSATASSALYSLCA